MEWARPEYSWDDVDKAGRILASQTYVESLQEYEDALVTINNWRSSHAFPQNTLQMNLRTKTKSLGRGGLVAQRIKRLPALRHKLIRIPDLTLSEMQDIGGCRAVVTSVPKVKRLREMFIESQIKHQLVHEDDYISRPKRTGYRAIHLIYAYHSDKSTDYQGLKIELQLRTRLQHAWATAVETVGFLRQEMLKSNLGDEDWRRLFSLMGTAIAIRERCPPVRNTPIAKPELADELRACVHDLRVVEHLTAYQTALSVVKHPGLAGNHYFLLELRPAERTVMVTGYKKGEVEEASRQYQETERKGDSDVVLVSVDRVAALERAYPNYFLDTRIFTHEVRRAIGEKPPI